ncbi:Endoplasmic reticulum mannosyl-oligosaccharide 1,2-alpha-mannosidase [Fulvia fulva]|uniref:alpha-1,2-Mannosidase n=1 Tax=Passalora fulva TaxID=5499 RepID=A0A9Q8P505_PASFU|nr:Endoplasmic reticulum mannosyl-oligosaccharide 1,2-alpha-mannosidase [Fulvia fulva]KAK4631382.1 Endoplasmic reticulum mannosyl-oligosaccharide 1,2-alpha-mannosidase [Fulvia fulva]KAK4633392.1 Endoplasmic reticulum mannosyl-oligosaccharide 1,2-alpha-mannosidase [Fulvia fulva]UJO13635.1 Endoplasmic reticulum mannosyl-oligosaccharide 1,2-alpha-mannosidase [Fulvia fulva]WPV11181.1 Endoplasmic reticulum mannosyl-oligosaccharide 1,2-alpha-mannosidase [Fulvia fulva]WPV26913.1 Endoplasmic reticulum
MIASKRYLAFAAFAIFVLFLVAHFHDSIASQARVRYDTFFPSASKHHADGRFHWADVPVQHPVESLTSLPSGKPKKLPRVQYDFKDQSQALKQKPRQAAVKATFVRAWKAYKQHAWMKDEVTPINGNFKNTFGGWAATLVDSLDTLWIMDMRDEYEEAVNACMDIDLGISTTDTINVFETTIRHLGGFLSAYDLSGDRRLLEKAQEFGEMLLKAFDTPNRMPITRWKPQEALYGKQEADGVVLVAEIGSLTMEFAHLSQVTGDMRWYDAVDRIMRIFHKQLDETHLPGMFPVVVNAKELDFTQDTFFTLSAMSDSFYEYFPKMHALLGGTEPMYTKLYTRSMQTAIKHNLWRPMVPDEADILMSGNVKTEMSQPPTLEPQGQHLVCFAGGMFALGGRLFEQEEQVKIGQKLTDGCVWTYKALPMGIMPEVFNMVPCPSRCGECKWDEQKWKTEIGKVNDGTADVEEAITELRLPKGFTQIRDRRYILRPEAIESVFILYRATGQEYLLDAAWDMFQSIINATKTPLANAALADVTYEPAFLEAQNAQVKMDDMESFWMAETLKYFYLIFSETSLISLDEYVFNTEAHPFKRALP